MDGDIFVKEGVVIPRHEIEITASRAGGPGGQHVNKTSTKITLRWNVHTTNVLSDAQKERVSNKLSSRLTVDGDLIVHSGASRSQQQNKEAALKQLAKMVSEALHIPKKRMKTRVSKAKKEERLKDKKHRSRIKKMRKDKGFE